MKKLTLLLFIFSSAFLFSQKSDLKKQISEITKNKQATVAVSIKGIDFPFELNNENAKKKLPMQSVFKFHIAATVLDWVNQGKLDSNQKIFIKKTELLENTWSPIREKYPNGNIELTIAELINFTVAQSDNNGCDILLRLIGGTKTVQQFMDRCGVRDFQIKFNEEEMHQDWNAQYENYTTTESMSMLLNSFYNGEISASYTTNFLMQVMLETSTGINKLKEQLPKGTPIAHKTGSSGKNEEGLTGAENDAGIITLPNGKHYAITIFVNDSKESYDTNCKMISDISKITFDYLSKNKFNPKY